ncbi:class I SAM-dependent methyltransferase [Congregibacter litoralis]|uniref:Putative O-methyltransferase n=1 Tax=Congregibacter litoralis KT71 TaxID=314285 RepID=A4A8X7_9GAMM|nr:class I SAM-dependent methyltransferase [Congregibacter litoralis]EAQ97519.1 putative O-methyltransferase [Congregibacter litoralis KT71]
MPDQSQVSMPIDINSVKGFLSPAEGNTLFECAREMPRGSVALEIGSYCGKSTVYLGLGCKKAQSTLFAVDHHRGSEEHQAGELFHDPELVDETGAFSTLANFRSTIRSAGLDDTVIPVLSSSAQFARVWQGSLSLVFIDGGHSLDAALLDYRSWVGFIPGNGRLAIHDVYPDSETGGQAPITIYRLALASGLFREVAAVDSLRVLERL